MPMSLAISCTEVADLLAGDRPFALIDVREAGEYNASHITGSSLSPRRELELRGYDLRKEHPAAKAGGRNQRCHDML